MRPEDRFLTKATFVRAPFPRGLRDQEEYFISQLKISHHSVLSYPTGQTTTPPCEIPAYVVFSFTDGAYRLEYAHKKPKTNSHFVSRVGREDSHDCENQFSKGEIREFAARSGKRLEDSPALWVTAIEKTPTTIRIGVDKVGYYSCFVLCNDAWFQARKFPIEDDYPFFLLQKHLPSLPSGSYRFLEENPAILGLEVIFITKDRKIIFQKRSGATAINPGILVSSVSAGYEPSDIGASFFQDGGLPIEQHAERSIFAGAFRELQRELGVDREQIERYALLGLVHVVASNELNFVLLMETSLTCTEFIRQLRKNIEHFEIRREEEGVEESKASEHFEYWKILAVDCDEVRHFCGPWRDYFERNRKKLGRALVVLYFYCMAENKLDSVPWHKAALTHGR